MSTELARLEITVRVEDRGDGGIHVTSDDVPGLFLSGSDREKTWGVVGPSVKYLLKANRGFEVVSVRGPMSAPDAGDHPMHVEHLVVEYRKAA